MADLIKATPVDYSVPFDNIGTTFVSTNVHDALVEAKQNAEGFPRAGLVLTVNGTVGNGVFITYNELLANTRIVFPVKIRLKEITWNNVNVSLGAFDFVFYKNGTAAGNIIHTYTAPAAGRTAGYGYYIFPVDIDINAGEFIYVKNVRPSGTALADLGLVLWISRIQ